MKTLRRDVWAEVGDDDVCNTKKGGPATGDEWRAIQREMPARRLKSGEASTMERTAVVHVKTAEASSEKIDVRDGALDMYFIRCHIFVCQEICMLDFDPCLAQSPGHFR